MPSPKIQKSGNQALDIEIENLLGIDTAGHTDTKKYKKLTASLNTLATCISKYYPDAPAQPQKLGQDQLDELSDAYGQAIRECRNYTSGKGLTRKSGFGTARVRIANAIEKILNADLLTIQNTQASSGTTLPEIMINARSEDVRLDVEEKDLNVVGANSSTRIPIRINTVAGTKEGFFTEDYKVLSVDEIDKTLRDKYAKDLPALNSLFDTAKDYEENKVDEKEFFKILRSFQDRDTMLKNGHITKDMLIQDDRLFDREIGNLMYSITRSRSDTKQIMEQLGESEETRRKFLEFMDDTVAMADENFGCRLGGKISVGQNIPNGNVAMSRIADLIGVGGLIAKAERMNVKDKDGYVREGVFQEAVKGSDINHLRRNDPMYALVQNPDLLNNPNLIRQISDLQVLDYVCGNTDRHLGNMLYQFEMVDGELKFTGIKGIDNDRSLGHAGLKDANAEGHFVPPEMMGVISQSTMDAVNSLNKDKLTIALKDMNYTDAEINACLDRVQDIRSAVVHGKLRIVPDNEFNKLRFDDLAKETTTQNGQQKVNTFGAIKRLSNVLSGNMVNPAAPIEFNDAVGSEKDYSRNNHGIYVSDLANDLSSLENIEAKFIETERALHINRGGYKWMLSSLKAVKQEIEELQKKYPDRNNDQLSDDEAKKLDDLYRAMRKASNEYLSDHQNPSTEMGQTRKSGAEIMSDMRPPRLGHPNAIIHKTTIEDMTKAFDASRKSKNANTTAPARKERITKKSVAKAKQEHQSENSRNHSSNQRDSSIRSF